MGKFRFACCLIQFAGEETTNPEKVFREVAEAGWEGVEGLRIGSAENLVEMAVLARRFGLHLVNMLGTQSSGIDGVSYNITLGNDAAEVPFRWRAEWGGANPGPDDFERAMASVRPVIAFAKAHGVKPFHHAHLGSMIETVQDAERFLALSPDLWLLLDTGHLLAAGSDPLDVFSSPSLRGRIGHVHLKDVHADDPSAWDHRTQTFGERARFAELGAGNMGLDVVAVLDRLEQIGYNGWISVELDRPYPPRPAAEAARVNRETLRHLGY
jgi:sugar phosphate isomerase/epimerase